MPESKPFGVLVVDLQPAFASSPENSGTLSEGLMLKTIDYLEGLDSHVPIMAFYVNEELSGDTQDSVTDFWAQAGASQALLSRIKWVEKSFAFLRGWMDQGVPVAEIEAAQKLMREHGVWDTRQLPSDELLRAAPTGSTLADPAFLDEQVELACDLLSASSLRWLTCGGGRDECLAEVEHVLQSRDIEFERIDELTY